MPISKVLKNVNKGTTEEESNENNEDEEDLFFSVQTSNICSKLIIVSLLSILQSRTYNVAMTPKKSKDYIMQNNSLQKSNFEFTAKTSKWRKDLYVVVCEKPFLLFKLNISTFWWRQQSRRGTRRRRGST